MKNLANIFAQSFAKAIKANNAPIRNKAAEHLRIMRRKNRKLVHSILKKPEPRKAAIRGLNKQSRERLLGKKK